MGVLLGGTLGLVTGVAVWLVSCWLVSRYRPETTRGAVTPAWYLFGQQRGAVSPWAALAVPAMAAWGAYAGWQADRWEQVAASLLVTGLLLAASLVDLQVQRIPNALVLGLVGWAVLQVIWLGEPSVGSAVLAVVVSGGPILLLALFRPGAMGWGDVKLAAVLGAILGFPLVLHGLLWGALAGGMAALALLTTRRAGRKDMMAYGPYLALGGWIVWIGTMGLWP